MVQQLTGLTAGLLPGIVGMIGGARQKRMGLQAAQQANALNAQALNYANQQLGNAQGMQAMALNNYNGRGAGVAQAENSIYSNQANTLAGMRRGARSSADMLAMAGATQGQVNNALTNLQAAEAQDQANRFETLQQTAANVQGAQNNLQGYYGGQAQQAQQSANQLYQSGATNQMNALNQIGEIGVDVGMGNYGNPATWFQKRIPKSITGVRNNSYSPLLTAKPANLGITNGLTPGLINFGTLGR